MKISNLLAIFVQFITPRAFRAESSLPSGNINFTSDLNQNDRQLFDTLCQFLWIQGDPLPLIFDVTNVVYTKEGITSATLKRLDAIGLIIFDTNGFVKKGFGKHTRLFYCGKPTKIGFQNDANNSLDLGHVVLTERGKALALAYQTPRNQEFYEYVIKKWFHQGLILSSIQIDRNPRTDFVDCACSIKE
ncbi:uncharacterized protein DUF2806 [Nitrosomonas sp. Nm84]|uniref:DUF2806 domain-containing protein n=1 Tax=Nitrosomonas sp. Nm84 TaxID=200124 RepID=UPI000D756016|nr:DUF2806 domain-containing protein [Nitrosomonas sp. Nm84]PXW90814.1 uncharacterized protein DUF2806 [Nitrosomonas sp. Nm84]